MLDVSNINSPQVFFFFFLSHISGEAPAECVCVSGPARRAFSLSSQACHICVSLLGALIFIFTHKGPCCRACCPGLFQLTPLDKMDFYHQADSLTSDDK